MPHTALTVKDQVCDILSVEDKYDEKNCNHTEPCAVYKVDPVCNATNIDCYKNRTQIIKKFNNETILLLENIDMRYEEYSQTLSDLVFLSSEIAVLKLRNISKKEEIEATRFKINSSLESERVANKSYQSIKLSNERILSFRNALQGSTNSIIRITDVSFDVAVETQTPVIVPLNVIYEITSRRTTHKVRIVVDISATDDLVKKTIYDNIYDDIIDNVIGEPLRKRRNVASSVLLTDIFKDNCNLQKSVIHYIEQLNLSLSAVQEDIFDSVSAVNSTRENENSNYEATVEALRSIGTNLSLSLLVNEGMIYASQMDAFDLVSSEIADTKVSQWKANLDELHNETSNLFGQTCYSLLDCLSTSVINIRKLIAPLAIFNTSEMTLKLENVWLSVQDLTNNANWTLDDMQYTINKVYSLALEVEEDSYWCASSPVLLDQPPTDIDEFVGASLSFSCPSSSLLPVTYSWYKNRKPIPFATTSSLSIPYLTRADAGLYECEVKNAIGVTKSKPTVLRVYKKATFTQEPDSITVINNDRNDAYFICQANAYPLPNYQWSYRRDNYSKWNDLDGETEGLLSISNISNSNEGQYRCQAENANSTIYSRPVTLTVLPGTFTRMSYNFTITINNVDNSSLIQSLENSLINAVDDLIDVNLTPVKITSAILANNQLIISFVLLSSNYSILSESDSNEVRLNQTIIDLRQLQANKITLDSVFHNTSNPFTLKIETRSRPIIGILYTVLVPVSLYSIETSLISPLMFDCPSGYQFDVSQFVCVGCNKGSYQYKNYAQESVHQSPGVLLKYNYPVCELCPKGAFQSDKAAHECNSCPQHYSTVGKGSTSIEDCQALCAPGTYSDTGYEPCQKCPVSHYQTLYGSKFCLPCTKESNISTCIKDQCKEDQYSSTSFEPCQSCDKGTYQESRGQVSCINCTETSTNIRCLPDCHLPPYAGPCNGKFQRYFYNKTSKQCETFTYGGCNQNKNNFHYQYDCENECGECPPTCTAQFCLLHRFNVCSMSPFPEPNNNCPGGCRLSSCQAYYYSPTIEPHPKGGDSCTKCDGQELDVTCMKNWGTCLRIAYIQSPDYEYHPVTPANFHCWEYKC
ncbi:PREDICTED: uncharacterized protein LOC109586118 isoform X1 [Amphimedon queenslandica]|nr:PREDICTED: uncharacterized protein LOC109586118 isoform X1 [Amphimedon queenslandica]|eukprot:XP_019857851.1 PREDICTED: uncharacterized protein LOC109586118 isoform X1 [Amphimedon queenslandica]